MNSDPELFFIIIYLATVIQRRLTFEIIFMFGLICFNLFKKTKTFYKNIRSEKISILTKTKNNFRLNYVHENKKYFLVLPKNKKSKWSKCFTVTEEGEETDITSLALKYAGPNKNFFQIKEAQEFLIREGETLIFRNKKGEEVNL